MNKLRRMEARVLQNERDIIEAKKLAYEVLVAEQQWEIKADNPSGLHVKTLPEGKVLWDDYDSVANWLGAFHENTLVGCMRICRRLKGKFEFEPYHELLGFIKEDDLAVESTRFLVKKTYRQTGCVLLLARLSYKKLLETGGYLFGAGFFPNPGQLYVNKFGMTRHEIPFRYHPDDPQEVYLYYINGYDKNHLQERIDFFEKFLTKRKLL